jgi:hypothetical protein
LTSPFTVSSTSQIFSCSYLVIVFVGPNNFINFIIIFVSTFPSLLYINCFLPDKFIAVNIINVTPLAISSGITLDKNFYADPKPITSSFTHYYFPYLFIDRFDSAAKDKN